MSDSIKHSAIILKLNERLFRNALAGVTEEAARERLSNHNNPLIWIATHTAWARYNMAALLGKPAENPYKGLFESFKPFEASMPLPLLSDVLNEWNKASALLNEGLATVKNTSLLPHPSLIQRATQLWAALLPSLPSMKATT